MVSSNVRETITRMEQDHNSPFCQLDPPRHPSLKKPWTNYWRFNCIKKCSAPIKDHAHTVDCEILVLEHVGTSTSTKSNNIFESEFPAYIMRTVEVFQQFADEASRDTSLHAYHDGDVNSVKERPTWTYIKIRSNYKSELQLTVCGKAIRPLIPHMKRFFNHGPGRACNVVSLYCLNLKWSQKKTSMPPTFLSGCLELRDKVGPITMKYTPKTNINFNSIEAIQLGLLMTEFLQLCNETTLIDIGCNFGALSLMLSHKCDKVIGLNTLQHDIDAAEELKSLNGIYNATFITCQPKDVQTKCMPLVKKCRSVAMMHLATPYGKNSLVYRALRALPTVWSVVIYGTFSRDFYKLITTLICTDDDMGQGFLPKRGCVIDKSPSLKDAFDIAVLFERPSLIEKTVQYIQTTGSTCNVNKEDRKFIKNEEFEVNAHNSSDRSAVPNNCRARDRLSLPTERSDGSFWSKDNGSIGPKMEKSSGSRPPPPSRRSRYDSASNATTSSSWQKRPEFDFLEGTMPLKPKTERFDQKVEKEKLSLLKPKTELFDKEKSRRTHEESAPLPSAQSTINPSQIKKEKEWSADQLARLYNQPVTVKQEKDPYYPPLPTEPSVEHGRHHPHLSRQPTAKQDKNPYRLPVPTEQPRVKQEREYPDLSRKPAIKQEKDPYSPPLQKQNVSVDSVRVKLEPRSPRREDELSSNDASPALLSNIKNETMDLDSSYVSIKSETVSVESNTPIDISGVVIKSEPVDFDDIEPCIMQPPKVVPIVANDKLTSDEFQNMKTPVHVPAAFSPIRWSSPSPATVSFRSVDGSEFSMKSNQSFLAAKQHEAHPNVTVKREKIIVKEEPVDGSRSRSNSRSITTVSEAQGDDDNGVNKENQKRDLRERLKYMTDNQRKRSEDDLRNLIERHKKVQKSPSPHSVRRRSPSHSRASSSVHYRRRSPSPSPKHNRRLSPSPVRYRRSPSPTSRFGGSGHPKYRSSSSSSSYSRSSVTSSKRYRNDSPQERDEKRKKSSIPDKEHEKEQK
ncbi:muscle M-line assembly protein unc-89-like [Copidosoma floridanum]|uniref:muscle M-line assembly protein unc-89-like n=1 Tax=Copidosoma floridanum TaxID=29053 RepID=UPI0006C9811C|nr:muscle M-line assembly protein unc-89-like [Copidosoma floridanum]